MQNDFLPAPLRAVAPYWVLALIVFAFYGNIFDNVFLFDDALLIELDSYLRDWHHIGDILTGSTTSGAHIAGGFYRPVQMLLYLLVFQLGNGATFGFHLLNLTLHAANTCFVYRLGRKLGFKAWGVFLAALIWGLHPLHTEAVTYMSATADPLFAFFCLWAIIILIPQIPPPLPNPPRQGEEILPRFSRWLGKACDPPILKIFPLFLLGLFSKETTVMFPLLVMTCLFFTSPQRLNIRTYFRTWPLWAVSLIYVFWRMHAKGFDGPQTYAHYYDMPSYASLKLYADQPIDRLYTFFATLPAYLQLILNPVGLHMERSFTIYPDPWHAPVMIGIGLVLAALALIIHSARAQKAMPMAWGLLWFGAAHAPDTGILIPMNSLFLEHWMYLPSVGLFLGLAETLSRWLENRPPIAAYAVSTVALIFAGSLAIKTYDQNKIWRDPDVFYNNMFSYHEISARARNNLALYYSNQGRRDDALAQFNEAIKISDVYAETHYNIALTYLGMPDKRAHMGDIVAHLKRSLEIDPHFYRSYKLLGDVYEVYLNDKENAALYHAKAAALTPPL